MVREGKGMVGDAGAVKDVKSKQELDGVLRSGGGGGPVILHFWASWCEASKQMDKVFCHLSTEFPHAHFFRVEAEEQPEISECYSVNSVPFFAFFKGGKFIDTLEGADPASLANKVGKVAGSVNHAESAAPASLGMAAGPTVLETAKENGASVTENPASNLSGPLRNCLQQLANSHPVFLFMKGTPDQPRCGFSHKVVDILRDEGVEFGSFDVLTDNEMREGMKKFSNWPTFPQLFCKGEPIGGCDIASAMHESGELKEVFRDNGVVSGETVAPKSKNLPSDVEKSGGTSDYTGLSAVLTSPLENLVSRSPVMLFMKGTPEEPRCGFSRKAVEILQQEKVGFESFDILSDAEVRKGLMVFSNWSSFPQLYIKGELIGGSDVMLGMQRSGELRRILTEKGIFPKETIEDRLRDLVSSSTVMLFMKGIPDAPRHGFRSKVVDTLRGEGIDFDSFDILTDEEVRQGLKTFSNWPTFPQVYHKGELIGGCDVVLELHKNGELKATLTE